MLIGVVVVTAVCAYGQFPSGLPVLEHARAEHGGEFKVGGLAAMVPESATLLGARGSLRLSEGLMLFVDGGQISAYAFQAAIEREGAEYTAKYVQPGVLFTLPLDALELPVQVALRGTLFKAFFPAITGSRDLGGHGSAEYELELDATGTSLGALVSGSPMEDLDLYGGLIHHSLTTKYSEKFDAKMNSGRLLTTGGVREDTTQSAVGPTLGAAYSVAETFALRGEISFIDEFVFSAGAFLAF